MAAAALLSPPTRRGLQFSLGGMMFIFVLGVSIGLAYSRLPLAGFADGLLASFIVWFLLGMAQRLWRDFCRIRQTTAMSYESRWGALLRVGTSLGIIVLVIIAAGMHESCRRGSTAGIAWSGRPGAFATANILFFLAIMGAYWSPPRTGTSPSRWLGIVRFIRDVVLIGIACFWAAQMFINIVATLQLVHLAIRGVESAQPTRWAGRPFYPFQLHPPSTDRLFSSLLAAFALLAAATAASALLLRYWRRGWIWRCAWLCVAAPCVAISMRLVDWSFRIGLPEVSPFFATAIDEVTVDVRPLYAILAVVLGAAIAMVSTVVSASVEQDSAASQPPRRVPLIHEHAALAVLCIVAVFWQIGIQIWRLFVGNMPPQFSWLDARLLWWYAAQKTFPEYLLDRPDQMIGLAAAVVLVAYLYRRWRCGLEDSEIWLVRPDEFFATWLVSVITIALLVPIVVCGALVAALANMPAYY